MTLGTNNLKIFYDRVGKMLSFMEAKLWTRNFLAQNQLPNCPESVTFENQESSNFGMTYNYANQPNTVRIIKMTEINSILFPINANPIEITAYFLLITLKNTGFSSWFNLNIFRGKILKRD